MTLDTDLELSEHTDRLHLPGVSAAHEVVLQDGAGGKGEVAHLAVDHVSHPGAGGARARPCLRLSSLLGVVRSWRGAGVGGHTQQGTCFSRFAITGP